MVLCIMFMCLSDLPIFFCDVGTIMYARKSSIDVLPAAIRARFIHYNEHDINALEDNNSN